MSSRKKIAAFLFIPVFVICFACVARFVRTKYVVPILMYHMVDPRAWRADALTVSDRAFRRQMQFLRARRYNVIPLEEVADLVKNKKPIPPKTVAITFDDGYRNSYTCAFPILKEYRIPATVFIIVNEVERARGDRLSWIQIREMRDSGLVSIGSHCLGPDPLIKIKSEEALRKEIVDSKNILEGKLGTAIHAFSYPEGMFTPRIRQLVIDAGYTLAVATNPGKAYPSDDVFALKRLRISENCRNMFVFLVESSGFYTWIKENKRRHKR